MEFDAAARHQHAGDGVMDEDAAHYNGSAERERMYARIQQGARCQADHTSGAITPSAGANWPGFISRHRRSWKMLATGGAVVSASAAPDVTTPRTAAATSADRTNDILADSLMRLSEVA